MVINATKTNPKLKIIGLCFGHQAISKYFGAKVEPKPLVAGIERIYFKENIGTEEPFLEALVEGEESDDDEKPFYMSEYHGDNVTTLP